MAGEVEAQGDEMRGVVRRLAAQELGLEGLGEQVQECRGQMGVACSVSQ